MINILKRVNNSKRARTSLAVISHASALVAAFCYMFLVVYAFLSERSALVMLIFGASIPFVLVTLLRHFIDAPRPYELYDFFEYIPKEKKGHSFPSRHVFSAFVIATLAIPVSIPLAAAIYLLGVSLSISRVFLGIHFIRDVLAGALIGIISGVIAILIF